jgi:ATP-dependent Clp protease protease subunit
MKSQVHTGKALEDIENNLERDRFMSAEEALAYGLIDEVVQRRPDAPLSNKST